MEARDFTERAAVRNLMADLRESCNHKEFSDIVDAQGNQYIDLVMEGGGVLGIALVGYTYVLEAMGIRFLGVGGTSAGSINALLIASLGTPQERKSERIVELLANLDMYQFVDGDSDARDFVDALVGGAGKFKLGLKALQVLDNLEKDLGLHPGTAFSRWLSGVLRAAGVTSTRQLKDRMATLPTGLRSRGGKPLTMEEASPYLALVAADISTETKVEFPKMAPLYWADPDSVDPALYVRASMSIPFFFHPFRVEGIPQGAAAWERWKALASYTEDIPPSCTFVDGGIMSNFPIDLFHQPNTVPAAPTFGAKLGLDERQRKEIITPLHLLSAIFDSARHCLDYDFIKRNPDYRQLVTWIDTGEHNWLNFRMPDEDKIDLFVRGAKAAAIFLQRFAWVKYKDVRREMAKAFEAGL